MSEEELVAAYVDGKIGRRVFVRRMVAAGLSTAAALTYAGLIGPSGVAFGSGTSGTAGSGTSGGYSGTSSADNSAGGTDGGTTAGGSAGGTVNDGSGGGGGTGTAAGTGGANVRKKNKPGGAPGS
jgi:hypothetical protein